MYERTKGQLSRPEGGPRDMEQRQVLDTQMRHRPRATGQRRRPSVQEEGALLGSSALVGGGLQPRPVHDGLWAAGDRLKGWFYLTPRSEYRLECGNCQQTLPTRVFFSVLLWRAHLSLPKVGNLRHLHTLQATLTSRARRCPCHVVTQADVGPRGGEAQLSGSLSAKPGRSGCKFRTQSQCCEVGLPLTSTRLGGGGSRGSFPRPPAPTARD